MESFEEAWGIICSYCKTKITDVAYNTWISRIEPIELDFDKNKAVILVPNDFHRQTITRCYLSLLNEAFEAVFGQIFVIEMKIPEEMKHIGPYGIPYRSILPTKTEGLLTAGRIISATRIAHSSLRVQPICSNIGMAAGTAAAMSALNQTGLRSIDIKQLQDRLASMGLFDGIKKK